MDDIRKSLSKLKKDFKHRVGTKKRGQDRAGADTVHETVDSPASLPRPDPRVEDGRISTSVSQVHSRDPSPHPEPVTANEDHLDDGQRKEVDVDEKERSGSCSGVDPDADNAVGSGPSREVKQASSPLFVTAIEHKQEPDSACTLSPQ